MLERWRGREADRVKDRDIDTVRERWRRKKTGQETRAIRAEVRKNGLIPQ